MLLIPIQNRLLQNSSYSVLLRCQRNITTQKNFTNTFKGLTPVGLVLVPRRHFGQGERIRVFGHATSKVRSHKNSGYIYPDFFPVCIFAVASVCLYALKWDDIKLFVFGDGTKGVGERIQESSNLFIKNVIGPIYDLQQTISYAIWRAWRHQGGIPFPEDVRRVDKERHYVVESQEARLTMEENKEAIHEYMKKQALERYRTDVIQMAQEDPELKALLDGQDESTIKVSDKETFELKKKWVSDYFKALHAESVMVETEDLNNDLPIELDLDAEESISFRSRKIIEYENRIRQYSTPDKIFRYFASYKVENDKGHSDIMMTPEDFLRSITPGMKQPENLGLDRFITINVEDTNKVLLELGLDEASLFNQLGAGGLISFSDYIFLLTVLSTSRRHFEIAFKMFDLNGDGNVDAKEFEVVTNLMKSQSSFGAKHRDHGNTGSSYKGINSGLITYFFGENKEGNLTVDKFLEFQRQLQNEILRLEFNRKSTGVSNTVSEKCFAELLIAYAGFPDKKKSKMIRRVRKTFKDEDRGVTLEDYLNFYQVLNNINDIDTALQFYHIAGAPIERSTMKHVAHTVAGVDLSDHIIDVVFVLFDNDGDGKLSNKEFVSVMKQRAMRGLEKPKDTGIGKILSAMTKCANDLKPSLLKKE